MSTEANQQEAAAEAPAPAPIKRYSAALTGRVHEYGDVYSFHFRPAEPLDFLAGQYAHVRLEDPALEKSVRHLSMASAPEDSELSFTMHMREGSPYKQRFLRLIPGESITLFKLKGGFVLPEDDSRAVTMLAAGVGVTPFRSMLRHLRHSGRALEASLIHVDRGPFLYEQEFALLPWPQQRIGREELGAALESAVALRPQALYYIAGPTPFVFEQRAALITRGIAEERIRIDDFEAYEEQWPPDGAE